MTAEWVPRVVAALRNEIFSGPFESVAFVLGIANIVLLIRRNIWNYPVGIAMVTLYGYVFYRAHLYSDSLLQVFFFVVQIVGWAAWLRHRAEDGELRVETSSARELALYAAGTAAGALALGFVMRRYTPAAYPYWDASVASASVFAQVMLTMRRIENWVWWMGSNVISIAVYPLKGLYLSAGLYGFFLVMSAVGYWEWRGRLRAQRGESGQGVGPGG